VRSARAGWAVRRGVPALLAAAALGAVAPAPYARADDPAPLASSAATRYQVTLAARACHSYDEVMAARVREGGESPARPGRDSAYQAGQPVDPAVEAANDDGCEPLVGWRFTLGSGRQPAATDGTAAGTGGLSVVTGAVAESPSTVAQTPRLDAVGRATGGYLPGAVTMELSDDQVRLAGRRQLWVQGGTPRDPLLAGVLGKAGYGFGALRCGIDGQQGGNTQWLGFAAGTRHAFCFAYYVRATPGAGTVVVRVRPARAVGYPQPFPFSSTLAYSAGGAFTITTAGEPAQAMFVRSPGGYAVQGALPAGWSVADLACAVSRPGGGPASSTASTDPGAAKVAGALAAGDLVTCVYTVTPPAAPPGLSLTVYAENGSGTFGLSVEGADAPRALSAAVAGDRSAAAATGADLTALPAGGYTVRVVPPGDQWSLAAASCNGENAPVDALTARVTLTAGVPLTCALRVVHRPAALRLRVVTANGVGGAAFSVVPADRPGDGWYAAATTTGYGVSAAATGDLPAQLPFGAYLVTPVPPSSTVDGSWELSSLACDPAGPGGAPGGAGGAPGGAGGAPGGTAPAAVRVELAAAADVTCTATYRRNPSTRLRVAVRAEGSAFGRDGPVVLEVSCGDGSLGRVVLAAGQAGPADLPEALAFLEPTGCTITQVAAGLAEGGSVVTTASLDPDGAGATAEAGLSLPVRIDVARDVPAYTVMVTDRFEAPANGPRRATFRPSTALLPIALAGLAMIVIGLLVLTGLALRRRTAP
jgi:hypothetical protein